MIGLALCGGGMKCAAHLGVLQVMEELGLRPALLAGSSMGAVIGALYASGRSPRKAAEELCRVPMSDVFLGGLPVPWLNHARRLRRLLLRVFGDQRIEDLPHPLLITACDLVTGAPVWIDRGSLVDALYASCAIPGLFSPVVNGDQVLADGCLAEPLPVSGLRQRGVRKIIGVDFAWRREAKRSGISMAMRSIEVLQDALSGMAAKEVDLVVQPVMDRRSGLWWNRPLLEMFIESGRVSAYRVIADLQRLYREDEAEACAPLGPSRLEGGLA